MRHCWDAKSFICLPVWSTTPASDCRTHGTQCVARLMVKLGAGRQLDLRSDRLSDLDALPRRLGGVQATAGGVVEQLQGAGRLDDPVAVQSAIRSRPSKRNTRLELAMAYQPSL